MSKDLMTEVQQALEARKGDWKQIAAEVPEVSYSWISQIGRGKYSSAPSYKKLRAVAQHLKLKAA